MCHYGKGDPVKLIFYDTSVSAGTSDSTSSPEISLATAVVVSDLSPPPPPYNFANIASSAPPLPTPPRGAECIRVVGVEDTAAIELEACFQGLGDPTKFNDNDAFELCRSLLRDGGITSHADFAYCDRELRALLHSLLKPAPARRFHHCFLAQP